MPENTFHNLSTITKRIQHYLQPAVGKPFWVKAEISSGRERGGSFYCDLVETDKSGRILAKIRCTIWSRDLLGIKKRFEEQNIDLNLEDGTYVGFQCSVQYSPVYGLSLKVEDADPAFALGELELKKREILKRLSMEGLFEINKKLFVPILPQKIGLITSSGSAAFNDFIKTLQNSPFGFRLYLADSNMQGNQTERSILQALDILERLDIELVVIIRGGGSKIDLYGLDNEKIARKIADYKYPVWTGIGHEIDNSVLDYVANRSFKTPTALSENIVARFIEMERHLNEAKNRFQATWGYRLEKETTWVNDAKTGLIQGTRKALDSIRNHLEIYVNNLSITVNDCLSKEQNKLSVSKSMILSSTSYTIKRQTAYFVNQQARLNFDKFQQRILHEKKHIGYLKDKFQTTWGYRLEKETTWINHSKTGVKEGTRKLLDTTKSYLKNYVNSLSIIVNVGLSKEQNKMSVSKSMILSLPSNTIKRQAAYLGNQQVRLKFGKFQQRMIYEKKNIGHQKDQLLRFFNIWVNNFKRDIGYFKYRMNKEQIFSRLKNERLSTRTKKATLKAYDPRTSLKRGYSLVYNKSGKLLKSISEMSQNETIINELNDGKITSTVETIEEVKNE